jgi:hypothetical protein
VPGIGPIRLDRHNVPSRAAITFEGAVIAEHWFAAIEKGSLAAIGA